MIVELTENELWRAAKIGCTRQIENLMLGRADTHALTSAGWTEHITGTIGELAAAKALNIIWTPQTFSRRHDGDLGARHEVRTTLHPNGHLLLHPDDPDERYFYLVVGRPPTVRVAGWILGRAGKEQRWWDTKRTRAGAYMVPQSALRQITPKASAAEETG